jgi:HK97 family phage portal protein
METDGNLGDEQYEAFMRHFNHAQNFETPLLEYGIKYKPLSVDPVAAQLIQSETMSIQDIARILNVPPHMLAELSHATFSNIEHQTIQFVQYSLRPIVKKIEVELRSKLFSDSERGRYKIKFSLDGLLRGDTAARSAYYHNAILDGYMTRNEVRALEGLERIEGLDKLLYPLNSGIVGEEPQNNKEESNE